MKKVPEQNCLHQEVDESNAPPIYRHTSIWPSHEGGYALERTLEQVKLFSFGAS